jgi:hypothetical protein
VKDLVGRLIAFIAKKEPAAAIGAVVSLLLAVQHEVAGAASWRDAAPALAALLVRRFVWSPHSVQAQSNVQYSLGLAVGQSAAVGSVTVRVGEDGSMYAPGMAGSELVLQVDPTRLTPRLRDEDPMIGYVSPNAV